MSYEHNTLWSKFRIIAASDSQSICALRYAWATRELRTICCLHERDLALRLSRRWNRPRVSDHERERFLHRVARNYNRHRKSQVLLTRRRFFPNAIALSESRLVWVKPHLHGRLFCNAIRRFFMRENLSRKAVTHTRQDSLAAIAFGKNRCRVSNTCDLRYRLYFCATRCNNRSRPWSLTRGRFQRLESHKIKSRSCKQQIVCNLRVAQA